ncbi:S100P-binding protein-like [Phycodurus eques]|uniref:S100P-binding protein-like n=1 Tax=Phycodurus eques TaxID=693459 RepID=UPI002ACEC302|nr:S100P-binding protein-like [Phycodurus eques]
MQSKRATFRHFKPLSAYARVAISEESPHKFPEPFINFHIEIFNNGATKRKWDDSNQESHDEMPAKKPFSPKVSTPDEGCFLSYCSPPAGQQSPLVHSQPSLFSKTLPIKVKTSESVSLEHEACKSAPEPCCLAGTNSYLFEYELFHHQPVFDSDVDELLCLNPSYGHKGADPHVKDDVDKGYLSMCLALSLQSPPACRQILKMAEYTIHPPSKVYHSIQSPDPAVGGLSLDSPVESFEGDAKEVWNIGPPVLESSACGEEESGSGNQKGEEVQPSETKPLSNCDNSLDDTSLEVQVKSVVHVVGQPTFSSTRAAPRGKYLIQKQLSTSTPSTSKDSIRSRRQVVLNTEEDWEREKRMYVQSVHRHISEASDAAQDAVSELWGLMTHVGHDSSGRPWQHPSDLTRRNYKAHLRNPEMKMSLHEWQAKNMGIHKRFEKVHKVFERSPVP